MEKIQTKNIKSFSRRIGKCLSNIQQNLLEEELPKVLVDKDNPLNGIPDNIDINLEIGIGMAQHFINQCVSSPAAFFIGCEPYLNGIANALKLAKEQEISNFKLWNDDADLILANIKPETFSKIFLLFPDPWPKTKQKKRRFAGIGRTQLIKSLLKKGGDFIFASDIQDYVEDVFDIAIKAGFIDNSKENRQPHEHYVQTKFHTKAIEAGRSAQFLILRKK